MYRCIQVPCTGRTLVPESMSTLPESWVALPWASSLNFQHLHTHIYLEALPRHGQPTAS